MTNLKEIKDECANCGELLQCELCRQGHGIRQQRTNIAQMVKCQLEHEYKSLKGDNKCQ